MEGKITLNPDDIVDNMDPFTDPKEAKNWVDCWDCGKPLYLGQYSNFVGPEYLPGGKLEQDGKTMWFCTSCWNMKKVNIWTCKSSFCENKPGTWE